MDKMAVMITYWDSEEYSDPSSIILVPGLTNDELVELCHNRPDDVAIHDDETLLAFIRSQGYEPRKMDFCGYDQYNGAYGN